MKHIVIDARLSRSTTGRYVDKLIEYLQEIDKENRYSIILKSEAAATWKFTNPNFTPVIADIKEFTFAEQLKLLPILYRLKPDLVHFPMVQQPILYPKRSVTTMHDLTTLRFYNPSKNYIIFKLKQLVYYFVNWFAVVKSKRIITISNFVCGDIKRLFPIARLRKPVVTYESADKMSDHPKSYKPADGKKFIFYVGQSHPHKNLPRLIDAFALLHQKNPDLVLLIVGKSAKQNQDIINRANDSPAKDSILITGFLEDGQLAWLYETAWLMCFLLLVRVLDCRA